MLPYLRLLRLPNVFTALADIALGYALARRDLDRPGLLIVLAAASGCLYLAGMVLNDLFDLEIDRRERPQRPLPSGAVSLAFARALGFGLLLLGVSFGGSAGFVFANDVRPMWAGGATATLLAFAILSYNLFIKHTWLGPVNMGLCRFLNVLLGATAAGDFAADGFLGWSLMTLLIAAGLGIYVCGITILSRQEAEERSTSPGLILGLAVLVSGLALVGFAAQFTPYPPRTKPEYLWMGLALLGLPVVRRTLVAIANPHPQRIQQVIKLGILSLILFDAALCWYVAPPYYALGVVALLIPAFLLGRWVYST